MTHDELRHCIEDQDRRLNEAFEALREMRGSVPEELVAQVTREFERITEITPQLTTMSSTPIGLRA